MLYTPLFLLLLTTTSIHASPLYADDSLAASDDKLHPLEDVHSSDETYVASEEDKQALRDLLVTIPEAKDNVDSIVEQMTHQPTDILNVLTEQDLLQAAQGGLFGGLLSGLGSIASKLIPGIGSIIPGLLGGGGAPGAPSPPSYPQYGGYPPQYGQPPPQYGGYPPQYGQPPPQYGGYPPQYGQPPPQYGGYPPQYGQPPPQYGRYPPPQYGGYPQPPRGPRIRYAKRDDFESADATEDTSASEEMDFDAAQAPPDTQASSDAQGSGDQVSAAQFGGGFPGMGFGGGGFPGMGFGGGFPGMGFGGGFPGMGFGGIGFGGGFPGMGFGHFGHFGFGFPGFGFGFPGFGFGGGIRGWRGSWGFGGGHRRWKRDELADTSADVSEQGSETPDTYDKGVDASTEESQALTGESQTLTEGPQADQFWAGFPPMFPIFAPSIGYIHPRVFIFLMSRYPHLFFPLAPFFPIELIRQTVAFMPGSVIGAWAF